MELRLEPNTDHTRRIRGRDYDDVTRTHAESVAYVEARPDILYLGLLFDSACLALLALAFEILILVAH